MPPAISIHNRRLGPAPLIASLLTIAFAATTVAQPDDAITCRGRGGVTIDQRIAACSSIIEAQTAPNEVLALAYGNRGVAKQQQHDLEGARKDHVESLRLDSSSASSHRFRGNLYLFDANELKATEEYRKAIEIDPKHGLAYATLGLLAARKGAFASAIEYLDKAIEFEPTSAAAYVLRGQTRIQIETYEKAVEDFTAALELGPLRPEDAFFGRGSAFAHQGEHQKALADYDEGIRLRSNTGDPFAIRCAIRAVLGQPAEQVMEDCDKAATLPNSLPTMRNMRGYALLKLDMPDRAAKEFEIVLRTALPPLSEPKALAFYGHGLASRRLGNTDASARDFEATAKASPIAKRRADVFFALEK